MFKRLKSTSSLSRLSGNSSMTERNGFSQFYWAGHKFGQRTWKSWVNISAHVSRLSRLNYNNITYNIELQIIIYHQCIRLVNEDFPKIQCIVHKFYIWVYVHNIFNHSNVCLCVCNFISIFYVNILKTTAI